MATIGQDLHVSRTAKPRVYAYSIMDQADMQETLLAELGIRAAHLLVHDYAVAVAQELLARQNEGRLGFALRSVCFSQGLPPRKPRSRDGGSRPGI